MAKDPEELAMKLLGLTCARGRESRSCGAGAAGLRGGF
jgi:hypothetical protein